MRRGNLQGDALAPAARPRVRRQRARMHLHAGDSRVCVHLNAGEGRVCEHHAGEGRGLRRADSCGWVRPLCEACAEGFNRERTEMCEWSQYGRLFGGQARRPRGRSRSVVSGSHSVPFSCLSSRARRGHGRMRTVRRTVGRTNGRAQGAWRTGRSDVWAEEGHLADRGQTDEWTRSGNKSVWKRL